MIRADLIAAGIAICCLASPAAASDAREFDIRPGPLGQTLVAFGIQAGLTIGINDSSLAAHRSRGLHRKMSIRDGLQALLAGTGAQFEFIDAETVRVVRAPSSSAARVAPRRQMSATAVGPPATNVAPDIIVTGSKQKTPLDQYAGSVSIIDLDPNLLARNAARGSAAVVAQLPILASTNLGAGRNKLFIRGVADSSFNGSTQATVGQYLGDVRLTYNAPDPDLNIYDMQRVEVLEGPQGTLYGTGSLGGIIRLIPNDPDPGHFAGAMTVGGVGVAGGGRGGDAEAMVNAPLIKDRLALRAIGFYAIDPGYIDDPGRNLSDINRTKSFGGRAALRFEPGERWTLTLGGAIQNIATSDGQYVLRGGTQLERRSVLAQPFDNDYRLAYFTVAKQWRGIELTSSTSVVRQDLDSRFDATPASAAAQPRAFDEHIGITLLSHETRVSGATAGVSWVGGISAITAISRTERSLGDPLAPLPIAGVRNANSEGAVFGQVRLPVADRLSATLGGRLSFTHSVGELLNGATGERSEPSLSQVRASPTAALAWQINGRLLAYVHAQTGFRAAGLQVAPTGAADPSQRVQSDSLGTMEAGVRLGRKGRDPVTASFSVAYASWKDIQSDLVDANGLPFTTNLGNGRIYSAEAQATWRVAPELAIDGSVFLNDSALSDPAPAFAVADERELPNVARSGARVGANYRRGFGMGWLLALDGALRYVGKSQLGIGAPLDVAQGKYVDGSMGARLSRGAIGLSIDISNITNIRGNIFAYGNPFGIAQRNQITPLVPRSIRFGLDARF